MGGALRRTTHIVTYLVSTPGETRTHTEQILSLLPLPLGYGGMMDIIYAKSSKIVDLRRIFVNSLGHLPTFLPENASGFRRDIHLT